MPIIGKSRRRLLFAATNSIQFIKCVNIAFIKTLFHSAGSVENDNSKIVQACAHAYEFIIKIQIIWRKDRCNGLCAKSYCSFRKLRTVVADFIGMCRFLIDWLSSMADEECVLMCSGLKNRIVKQSMTACTVHVFVICIPTAHSGIAP